MSRIAAKIEYKGTNFHGFERQKSGIPTIQQELEIAFSKVADAPIQLIVAGRTDAGVHANGQVIHFDTNSIRDKKSWIRGANAFLSRDISVLDVKEVPDNFHARFSAISRTYQYKIINRAARVSIKADTVFWTWQPLDIKKMQQAANFLIGEYDFSSFRAAACQANTAIRTLNFINIKQSGDEILTTIQGNAFLYHMVRNIMGTLLPIGIGQKPVEWMAEVLAKKDRKYAGQTITARGLSLIAVQYPSEFGLGFD